MDSIRSAEGRRPARGTGELHLMLALMSFLVPRAATALRLMTIVSVPALRMPAIQRMYELTDRSRTELLCGSRIQIAEPVGSGDAAIHQEIAVMNPVRAHDQRRDVGDFCLRR